MKVVRNPKALPRQWSGLPHGKLIRYEADLRLGTSRLAAKLLIFGSRWDMRYFWQHQLKAYAFKGGASLGLVNALATEVIRFTKGVESKPVMHVDPRYFCVIGLVCGHLSMNIIAHESVHAGFCYAKRVGMRNMWAEFNFDEELVAYPAGFIAAAINRFCFEHDLYEMKEER